MAWSTTPLATSSYRRTPGQIGRPAASALVHPDGRSACDLRSNTAPEPAVGRPPFHEAAKSSYRTQVSLLSMNACASDAGSIGVVAVKGYGTLSLSSA